MPLIASLDALFDVGLISFADDGKLLISPKLNERERVIVRLEQQFLTRMPDQQTIGYLAYHRKKILFG